MFTTLLFSFFYQVGTNFPTLVIMFYIPLSAPINLELTRSFEVATLCKLSTIYAWGVVPQIVGYSNDFDIQGRRDQGDQGWPWSPCFSNFFYTTDILLLYDVVSRHGWLA
jgi:hypothetical protein